jgi:hypothetical protein
VRDPEFAGCWVKIDRARQHCAEFERAANAWLETKPYRFRTDFDPATNVRVIRLSQAPIVPLGLCAIIGDALHNLRSALDHLIYRIAALESRQDPPPKAGKLAFPICVTKEGFDHRRQWLGDISNPMRASLEEFQPFRTHPANPRESALWILDELDIVDKHQDFPLVLIQIGDRLVLKPSGPGISIHGLAAPRPLEANAEFLVYSSEDPAVSLEFDPTFEIAFARSDVLPEGHAVGAALETLARNVETVVGSVGREPT